MSQLKQAFFTLLLIACNITLQAQQPSSFKLGEEELSGIDIYDILQDNDNNYWLATDNGLFKYDGYTFKKISSKNALTNSVFDLKLDYHNNLFCKNLSGQIFQVNNDSCKVYFQIPDSLMYKNVLYAFDNNPIYLWDRSHQRKFRYHFKRNNMGWSNFSFNTFIRENLK